MNIFTYKVLAFVYGLISNFLNQTKKELIFIQDINLYLLSFHVQFVFRPP